MTTLTRFSGTLCAGLLGAAFSIAGASAQDRITFLTSWYAQAEHGGFYQAKATGLYEAAGLDVTIRMGGPQVNNMQLLLAGEGDIMMGYDIQVLKAREQNFPLVTVGTSFQFDLQGIMTHSDVESLDALGDRTILVSSAAHSTYWPWMKEQFGYTDAQTRAYTFNLQPFFADTNVAQQGYLSSEPFSARQQGADVKFFLLADDGYPPYGSTIVTTDGFVEQNRDAVARFVKASLEGWRDYLNNPGPGNELIKADNPNMTDEQIAYAVERLKETGAVAGGDAETLGIGIMTEERWEQTYDFLVGAGLLNPEVDWREAFTDEFVKDLKLSM